MRKCLAAVLLFASCLTAAETTPKIEDADQAFLQASNAGDVRALADILTDDFVFVSRTGSVYNKRTYLDRVKAGQMLRDVKYEDTKARVYGNAAISQRRHSLNLSNGTRVVVIATHVFVKQGNGWKLALHQATQLPSTNTASPDPQAKP